MTMMANDKNGTTITILFCFVLTMTKLNKRYNALIDKDWFC